MDPSNLSLQPRSTSSSTKPPHLPKTRPPPSILQTLTGLLKPHHQSPDEEPLLQHVQPQPRSAALSISGARCTKPTSYRPSHFPGPEQGREKPKVYNPRRSPTLIDEIARREAERSRLPTALLSLSSRKPTTEPKPRTRLVPLAKTPTGSPSLKPFHPKPQTEKNLARKFFTRASGSFQRGNGSGSCSPRKAGYLELSDEAGSGSSQRAVLWRVDGKEVDGKEVERKVADKGAWAGDGPKKKDKGSGERGDSMGRTKLRKSVRFSHTEDIRYVRDEEGREDVDDVRRGEKTEKTDSEGSDKRVSSEWYFGN